MREASTTVTSTSTWTTIFQAGSSSDSKDGLPALEIKVQKISGDPIELRIYPLLDPADGSGTPDTVTLDSDRDTEIFVKLGGITRIDAKLATGGTTAVVRHTVTASR